MISGASVCKYIVEDKSRLYCADVQDKSLFVNVDCKIFLRVFTRIYNLHLLSKCKSLTCRVAVQSNTSVFIITVRSVAFAIQMNHIKSMNRRLPIILA